MFISLFIPCAACVSTESGGMLAVCVFDVFLCLEQYLAHYFIA